MRIFIPTNRVDQVTYRNLPPNLQRLVTFVSHNHVVIPKVVTSTLLVPNSVQGISAKRQYIIEHCADNGIETCIMMDDDLSFAMRRSDDDKKFTPATPHQITSAVANLESLWANDYAHGGISPRGGANFCTDSYLVNTRLLRVLAYHVPALLEADIKFNRIPLMEDFDVTLQLLRKGYANLCVNWLVQDQPASNSPGGCSVWRTLEMQNEAAQKLKDLHPDFVTLVRKKTTTSWNGQERVDVRIQWKKAYAADV